MDTEYSNLKTIKGVSPKAVYVVVAEDDAMMVALKPEAGMVYFDSMRRFFQIGFRIHVRPQEGKTLPPRKEVEASLNIGHLSEREDGPSRYVGQVRIPACNLTLSPWVVQENIVQGQLIEKLILGLYERLNLSGLKMIIDATSLIEMAKERFLDMIPDNKVPLPEVKVYFGKDSYYPPNPEGPPKSPPVDDEPGAEAQGDGDEA